MAAKTRTSDTSITSTTARTKVRSKKEPPPLPPPRPGSARAQAANQLVKPAVKKEKAAAAEPRPRPAKPAFPRKSQQPTPPAFAAQLPLALGKRFDMVRTFLLKQKGVREDVYFYGPESGWALRYLHENRPLCSLHIHDRSPVGIVSLEAQVADKVDWKGLSPAGRKARQQAHGSPSMLWLDVPLEEDGAADFRSILRAKLATRDDAGA
jgi:hypothetical protein